MFSVSYVLHIVDTVGRVLGHWTGFAVLAPVTSVTSGLSGLLSPQAWEQWVMELSWQ